MKAYKGFSKDMTCRGFKFEEGKEYHEDKAELCNTGFHACENPIDCFKYYEPGNSIYRAVELDGVSDKKDNDTKRVGTTITIGARLSVKDICRLSFDYVKEHCTNENNTTAGEPATAGNYGAATAGYNGAATAGNYGAATAGDSGAATAGDFGAATAGNYGAATAGDFGAATAGDSGAATAGNYGAATAGDFGAATAGYKGAATAGNYGAATAGDKGAATAGDFGAATAGNYGAATAGYNGAATAGDKGAATAGDKGAATAGDRGVSSSRGSSASGTDGLSVARGEDVRCKGGLGALLVIAIEDSECNIIDCKTAIVDGVDVKADTWYTLEDGKFKEVVS